MENIELKKNYRISYSRLVQNLGYFSFNLAVLFSKNPIKISKNSQKVLQKGVTIFFEWIKPADLFLDSLPYMESKN